jgi:hypothetical protein
MKKAVLKWDSLFLKYQHKACFHLAAQFAGSIFKTLKF